MNPVSVRAFACHSVHGNSSDDFWRALQSKSPPKNFSFSPETRGKETELLFLTKSLHALWCEIQSQTKISASERLGVIFSSTKGCIDDYIWDPEKWNAHQEYDSLTPVLENFLAVAKLKPAISISVSNACASSLSAVYLGMKWIEQKRVGQVLILSADLAGPFVQKGFRALNALTPTHPKPFAKNRDGLAIGEAVSAILIGENSAEFPLQIDSIGIEAEGYAVTRPAPAGASLKRAYLATSKLLPDLIIAHGTATSINDIAEDQAFFELFADRIPITGTKWAIGHTLGASGSMDLIAAFQAMKHDQSFSLATTAEVDPEFRSHYLTRDAKSHTNELNTVFVSSLGFGGVHAVALLTKNKSVTIERTEIRQIEPAQKIAAKPLVISEFNFPFQFPAPIEPNWKSKVDRWYQLDAPAYGLAEFYEQHRERLGPAPDLILLASPAASNATDYQFASQGAQSPAKFVHTLPNIRVSPLCQVMGWTGPVLCVQNGLKTLESALNEAKYLLSDQLKRIWVLSVKDLQVTAFVLETTEKT
jgi:hypothetical protein